MLPNSLNVGPVPPPSTGKESWFWSNTASSVVGLPSSSLGLPRISIVTPSYNQGVFLEDTIRSVLKQNYPNLDYSVIDGGSADNSADTIKRYEPWLTYWVSERDQGQAQALNKGFARATGDILGWLNSDDVYAPGVLWAVAEAFAANPEAVLIYGGAQQIDESGQVLGIAPQVRAFDWPYLLNENDPIAQPSAFFKRNSFLAAGLLDESLHFAMDYDLWFRLCRIGAAVFVPGVWSAMRIYPTAKTSSGDHRLFEEVQRVVARYGRAALPRGMAEWLAAIHVPRAFSAYRSNEMAVGRRELAYVIEYCPDWQVESNLIDALVGQAWQVVLQSGEAAGQLFIESLCRNLPENVANRSRVTACVLGLFYQALAFEHARLGRSVRRHIWQAIAYDKTRLFNRGLWALLLRSFFTS